MGFGIWDLLSNKQIKQSSWSWRVGLRVSALQLSYHLSTFGDYPNLCHVNNNVCDHRNPNQAAFHPFAIFWVCCPFPKAKENSLEERAEVTFLCLSVTGVRFPCVGWILEMPRRGNRKQKRVKSICEGMRMKMRTLGFGFHLIGVTWLDDGKHPTSVPSPQINLDLGHKQVSYKCWYASIHSQGARPG